MTGPSPDHTGSERMPLPVSPVSPVTLLPEPGLPWLLDPTGYGLRRSPIRFPDGSPPLPHGCRWCGMPAYRHEARAWSLAVGHHAWTRPTPAQTVARMKARRAARAQARRLASTLTVFERGAALVGPAERRRRRYRTRNPLGTPVPDTAPAPAAVPVGGRRRVCDDMTHNGIGAETFCQEDPDDGHPVHDDGDGTLWNRED